MAGRCGTREHARSHRWRQDAVGRAVTLDRQVLGFTVEEIYRWLMGVKKPRSAAVEVHFEGGPEAHAKKTLMLAQSPTVSEAEALANREYRKKLAEGKRRS